MSNNTNNSPVSEWPEKNETGQHDGQVEDQGSPTSPAVVDFIDALGSGESIPVSGPVDALVLFQKRQFQLRQARRQEIVEGLVTDVTNNLAPKLVPGSHSIFTYEQPVEQVIELTFNTWGILQTAAELASTPECRVEPQQIASYLLGQAVFRH